MPAPNNDEQFKFLISCIRHSNTGKVDFSEVAAECGIVSKGAAAKRYERLMKAHGLATNGAALRGGGGSSVASKRGSGTPNKKRKFDMTADLGGTEDDEEAGAVKDEPLYGSLVKAEQDIGGSSADGLKFRAPSADECSLAVEGSPLAAYSRAASSRGASVETSKDKTAGGAIVIPE